MFWIVVFMIGSYYNFKYGALSLAHGDLKLGIFSIGTAIFAFFLMLSAGGVSLL